MWPVDRTRVHLAGLGQLRRAERLGASPQAVSYGDSFTGPPSHEQVRLPGNDWRGPRLGAARRPAKGDRTTMLASVMPRFEELSEHSARFADHLRSRRGQIHSALAAYASVPAV